MSEKSPIDRLLARTDFKPFSGRHAFRVLELSRKKLKIPPVRDDDVLKAVSSLGLILETEAAMIVAIQETLCKKCGNCCRNRVHLRFRKDELQSVADYLRVEYKLLKDQLRATPMGDGTFIIAQPCNFLRNKLCSVYPVRPGTCRDYPSNDLLTTMERGVSFDGCPIANDLLVEIVVKRVMEEQMWRDHPEEFKAMAERRRGIWKSSPLSRKDKG
ncbi:MAG: YkgJ family cysteine cluster protein [Candidatus Bathyarchaeota archaeon]|nr:YkgJ family cysteine cluster protein [Candidatus Bathyarchaeota archaeon]